MESFMGGELENVTTLVVEDDSMVRKMMFAMLNSCGCSCVAVETAREALAFYQWGSDEVDIVFLDLHLPDGLGVDLLAVMYQINPRIRAVVMSGNVLDPVQLISTPGVTALLHKPFSYRALNEILVNTSMSLAAA